MQEKYKALGNDEREGGGGIGRNGERGEEGKGEGREAGGGVEGRGHIGGEREGGGALAVQWCRGGHTDLLWNVRLESSRIPACRHCQLSRGCKSPRRFLADEGVCLLLC